MAGLTGYKNQLERGRGQDLPPREWDRESRRKKKILARNDAVMFVPANIIDGKESYSLETKRLFACFEISLTPL